MPFTQTLEKLAELEGSSSSDITDLLKKISQLANSKPLPNQLNYSWEMYFLTDNNAHTVYQTVIKKYNYAKEFPSDKSLSDFHRFFFKFLAIILYTLQQYNTSNPLQVSEQDYPTILAAYNDFNSSLRNEYKEIERLVKELPNGKNKDDAQRYLSFISGFIYGVAQVNPSLNAEKKFAVTVPPRGQDAVLTMLAGSTTPEFRILLWYQLHSSFRTACETVSAQSLFAQRIMDWNYFINVSDKEPKKIAPFFSTNQAVLLFSLMFMRQHSYLEKLALLLFKKNDFGLVTDSNAQSTFPLMAALQRDCLQKQLECPSPTSIQALCSSQLKSSINSQSLSINRVSEANVQFFINHCLKFFIQDYGPAGLSACCLLQILLFKMTKKEDEQNDLSSQTIKNAALFFHYAQELETSLQKHPESNLYQEITALSLVDIIGNILTSSQIISFSNLLAILLQVPLGTIPVYAYEISKKLPLTNKT